MGLQFILDKETPPLGYLNIFLEGMPEQSEGMQQEIKSNINITSKEDILK